jgi:hypothetical protein
MIKKGLLLIAATVAGVALLSVPATAGTATPGTTTPGTTTPGTTTPTTSPAPTSTPITIPPGAVSWIPAACATGSIDPVTVDQGHYLLPTHVTICSPYNSHFRYAMALFRPGQAVTGVTPSQLSPYAVTGPADRTADVMVRRPAPVFGVCLMRDLRTRIACARVDIAPDGTAASAPIAVDDPLVSATVIYSDEVPEPTTNYCGTCVSLQ